MENQATLTGVGASEGVAVGPVFVHSPGEMKPERESITEDVVEGELERFRAAVEAVVLTLSETADNLRESGSEEEAGIFRAIRSTLFIALHLLKLSSNIRD